MNEITDNKTFWRTIKPYFNEKGSGSDKIVLSGNKSVLTNEKEIANTMNNYFISITNHLNLKPHTASNTMEHSHKKRKDSLETRPALVEISMLC